MTISAFLPDERELAALLDRIAQENGDRSSPTPVADLLPAGSPGARLSTLAREGLDFADGVILDACIWIDAWHRRRRSLRNCDGGRGAAAEAAAPASADGQKIYHADVAAAAAAAAAARPLRGQTSDEMRTQALVELALSARREEHRAFMKRALVDMRAAVAWYKKKYGFDAVFHIMLAARVSSRVPVVESGETESASAPRWRPLAGAFSACFVDEDENILAAACRAGPAYLHAVYDILRFLLCPWRWEKGSEGKEKADAAKGRAGPSADGRRVEGAPEQHPTVRQQDDDDDDTDVSLLGGIGKTGASSPTLVLLLDEPSRSTGMTAAGLAAAVGNADALLALHLQGADLGVFAAPSSGHACGSALPDRISRSEDSDKARRSGPREEEEEEEVEDTGAKDDPADSSGLRAGARLGAVVAARSRPTPPQSLLMIAARGGSGATVELLLCAGVPCLGVVDAWGRTAREVAAEACVMPRDAYQRTTLLVSSGGGEGGRGGGEGGRGGGDPLLPAEDRYQYRPDVAQGALLLARACGCCVDQDSRDSSDGEAAQAEHAYTPALPWLLRARGGRRPGARARTNRKNSAVLPGPYPSAIQSRKVPHEARSVTWALERVVRAPRRRHRVRNAAGSEIDRSSSRFVGAGTGVDEAAPGQAPGEHKSAIRDQRDGLSVQPRAVSQQLARLSLRPDWGECGPYSPRAKSAHVPTPGWRTPAAIDRELVLARAYYEHRRRRSRPRQGGDPATAAAFEALPEVVLGRRLREKAHDALVQAFGHSGGMDAVLSEIYGSSPTPTPTPSSSSPSDHSTRKPRAGASVSVAAYALAAARGSRGGNSEYPGATVLHAAARDGYAPAPQLLWALHCLHFSGLLPLIIDERDADGMTAVLRACASPNPRAEDHVLALLQHGADFVTARVGRKHGEEGRGEGKKGGGGRGARRERPRAATLRQRSKRCEGDTALHLAARKENAPLCALLLRAVERYFELQEEERHRREGGGDGDGDGDGDDDDDRGNKKTHAHNKYHSHVSLRAAEQVRAWRELRNSDGYTAAEVCPAFLHEEEEEAAAAAETRVVHHEYMDHRGFGSLRTDRVLLHPTSPCLALLMGTEDAPVPKEYKVVRRFEQGTYRPPNVFRPWTQWWDAHAIGKERGVPPPSEGGPSSASRTTMSLGKSALQRAGAHHVRTHRGCTSSASTPGVLAGSSALSCHTAGVAEKSRPQASSLSPYSPSPFLSPGARLSELQRLETLACAAEDAEDAAAERVRSAEAELRTLQRAHDANVAALRRTENDTTVMQVDRYHAKMQARRAIAAATLDREEEDFRQREGRWFPGSPDTLGLREERLLRAAREEQRVARRDADRHAASDTIDAFEEQERRRKRREKADRIRRMEKRKREMRRKDRERRRARGEDDVSEDSEEEPGAGAEAGAGSGGGKVGESTSVTRVRESKDAGGRREEEIGEGKTTPLLTQADRMAARTTLQRIKESEEIREARQVLPLNVARLALSFVRGKLDLRKQRRAAARQMVSAATIAIRTCGEFRNFQRRAGVGGGRGATRPGGTFDFTRLLKNGQGGRGGETGADGEGERARRHGERRKSRKSASERGIARHDPSWSPSSSDTSSSSAPDSDSEEEGEFATDRERREHRKNKRRFKALAEADHLRVDPRTYGHHLITSPGIPY